MASWLKDLLATFGALGVQFTAHSLPLDSLDLPFCPAGALVFCPVGVPCGGSSVAFPLLDLLLLRQPPGLLLLPCLVLVCWPPTCMSLDRSAGDIELSITLAGGLRVTILAPAASAAAATRLFNHVAAFQDGPEPSEFELVSSPPVSPRQPVPAPYSETRDQVRQSLHPCPSSLLGLGVRLCGSALSGRARVERAWLCGQWAGAVQSQRIHSLDRTPTIDLRSRFYAVLQASGLSRPTVFRSSAGYWACIGSLETSSSISQSFPSEAEARIYLQGAGVVDFEFAP